MLKTYIHWIYSRAISYLQKTLLKHRGYYKIEKENLEDFKMVKVSRTRRGAAPQRTLKDVRNEHKHGGKQDEGKGTSIFT